MRIDPVYTPAAALGAYQAVGGRAKPNQISYTPRPDTVEFSNGADELRRAQAAVSASSDVRADRVAEIKAQVQAGAYQVDTQALAETLIGVL